MDLPFAEPYRIKSVETIRRTTKPERKRAISTASYNLFNLRSEDVFVDLLTDSGTGAMSAAQWAEIMLGDESYAGASSYYKLKESIKQVMGFDWFLPAHQGRAAENVLMSTLIGPGNEGMGKVVPGNTHFDTTKGHIESRGARAVDCTVDEAFDPELERPFKGNVDLGKLEKVFNEHPRGRASLYRHGNLQFFGRPARLHGEHQGNLGALQALRRAAFPRRGALRRECLLHKDPGAGYADKSIRDIAREMFSYADGCTMSSKKDGIVNIGGLICFRDEELYRRTSTYNIMYEGFNTYGGMAGGIWAHCRWVSARRPSSTTSRPG